MENLSRCHREKSRKRLLPHSTYILQHKNDIVKNNKYGETVVFCFIKPKKRKINNSVCRKSMFFKKSACPQSLSPNPFPWKGAECGAAALTPLGATPQTRFLNCIGLSTVCKLSCFSAFLPLCLSSLFRFLRHILKQ